MLSERALPNPIADHFISTLSSMHHASFTKWRFEIELSKDHTARRDSSTSGGTQGPGGSQRPLRANRKADKHQALSLYAFSFTFQDCDSRESPAGKRQLKVQAQRQSLLLPPLRLMCLPAAGSTSHMTVPPRQVPAKSYRSITNGLPLNGLLFAPAL